MSNKLKYKSIKFMEADNQIIDKFLNGFDSIWEAVPIIPELIQVLSESSNNNFTEVRKGVFIEKTAKVSESANIVGPCVIDADAEVRANAFIRENVYIGKSTIIGNSSEIKNSIILDNAEIPHFNYVGDSILGNYTHLGAGAIISNFKQDRSSIKIRLEDNTVLDTGILKFGAIIGDHAEIGSNAVINPGTLIGREARIYPLTQTRGEVPAKNIMKADNKFYPISTK